MIGSLVWLLVVLGCLVIAYWAVLHLPGQPIEVIKHVVLAVLGMAALIIIGRFLISFLGSGPIGL